MLYELVSRIFAISHPLSVMLGLYSCHKQPSSCPPTATRRTTTTRRGLVARARSRVADGHFDETIGTVHYGGFRCLVDYSYWRGAL